MFADVCLLFLDNFYKIVQVSPIQVKDLFPLWSFFICPIKTIICIFIVFFFFFFKKSLLGHMAHVL